MVHSKRHIAKTISYRLISSGIGFLAMWFATGSIELGMAFSMLELVWKPIQYYVHERIWYRFINYGITQNESSRINYRKNTYRSSNSKR